MGVLGVVKYPPEIRIRIDFIYSIFMKYKMLWEIGQNHFHGGIFLILNSDEKDRWYLVFRWLPMGDEQVQISLPDISLIRRMHR